MATDLAPLEILRTVTDPPLEFPPGDRFEYSNTNYVLLGLVIEAVTGKLYGEFLAERIFRPLEMTSTGVADLRGIVKNRASGYVREAGSLRNRPHIPPKVLAGANGGLVSTVLDLTKWDHALDTGRVLSRSRLEQMWTPVRLNSGATGEYGLGWSLGNYQGHRFVVHTGGRPGVSTGFVRFPEDRLTVILLSNCSDPSLSNMVEWIAPLYLHPSPPHEDTAPQTTDQLQRVLLRLSDGEADLTHFTPEALTSLATEMKEVTAFYQSLGPLKSFRLIEQTSADKARIYRYRTVFRNASWIHQFVLTPEGKIMELGLKSE
jgi:CubicO group peptidase (beta-lactamase class C family)